MLKKVISLLLCLLLLGSLAACGGKDGGDVTDTSDTEAQASETEATDTQDGDGEKKDDGKKKEATTTMLNSSTKGIKILGERHVPSDTQINCDWTCSGIEFVLNSDGGAVTFKANSDKPCYFRAYVDGDEWESSEGDLYYKVDGETEVTLSPVLNGEHTVRFIKVTGHTLARAELLSVTYYGTISETAPADNDMYIEFIGDSISCGWGVIGAHDGEYSSQDGSLAYPYLIANALNADYSITALSGKGVVYGTPNMTNGYLLSSPLRDGSESTAYDFERKADVVVINMETNDISKGVGTEEFKEAYKNLIATVRAKNGDGCRIVCLYNTMKKDTEIGSAIAEICREAGGDSSGLFSYKMTCTGGAHPTAEQNEDYFNMLKPLFFCFCFGSRPFRYLLPAAGTP